MSPLPQPAYTDALKAFAASASTLVERRMRDAATVSQYRRRPRSEFEPRRAANWPDEAARRANHRRAKAIEAAYETGRVCDRPRDLPTND